jgi:hypothetical protein
MQTVTMKRTAQRVFKTKFTRTYRTDVVVDVGVHKVAMVNEEPFIEITIDKHGDPMQGMIELVSLQTAADRGLVSFKES